MRTPLWYSSSSRSARPVPAAFCTVGHAQQKTARESPTPLRKSLGPIAPPASSTRQPAPCPGAARHSAGQPPPIPHSHAPASTDTQDATHLVYPTAPPWSRDRARSSPAPTPLWHLEHCVNQRQ